MTIDHIGLWVRDLETMRQFYCTWFEGTCGPRYHNPGKQFSSYFVRFASGTRLELMHRPDRTAADATGRTGWAHLAWTVGDRAAVDQLTDRLRAAGGTVLSGPRTTGDGYYEAVLADPEGNQIEVVAG